MHSLPLEYFNGHDRPHWRLLQATEDPEVFDLYLSSTRLESEMTCGRKYEFLAVLGRDVGERDALNYGAGVHKVLEAYYKDKWAEQQAAATNTPFITQGLENYYSIIQDHFNEFPCADNSWRNLDQMVAQIRRYMQWRGEMDRMAPWIVGTYNDGPFVEVPFKIQLMVVSHVDLSAWPPALLCVGAKEWPKHVTIRVWWTGKIDLGRIDKQYGLRPLDHKTTSIGGPTFWSQFHTSHQLQGYTWATQKLTGVEVSGADVDMLLGKRETRTNVPFENEWQPYYYSQDQLHAWEVNMKDTIREMLERLQRGRFPANTTQCSGKYGMCPYFDVCKQSDRHTAARILASGQFKDLANYQPFLES